ncbi:hypothetical protein NFI96_023536, partial [Prochilodus magdalenae]
MFVVMETRLCVLYSRISGAEVELEIRVRPGDEVTLYCDCVWEVGFKLLWFRNCSHQHQPPLIISATAQDQHARLYDGMQRPLARYSFVWNSSSSTHDLQVKNVSESDLGLYYCALREKKVTEDETGVVVRKDVYRYGNRTTRLSLLGRKKLRAAEAENTENLKSSELSKSQVGEDGVCYASLDLPPRREKRLKKKRVESSEFSTYSERATVTVKEDLVSSPDRISGADVEMRVRPGDDVVLYSDCVWRFGFDTVWFRNSSHEHMVLLDGSHPRYSIRLNDCHQTTELLVRNVSESDLGLYFCALQKKRSSGDKARACSWEDVCYYGNRTTRLSFHGVLISSISGIIVEMRVKPGDNATMYCDCTQRTGSKIAWSMKPSHEYKPALINFVAKMHPHHSLVWNSSTNTVDLLVENITESDLGLYYCALHEIKITRSKIGETVQDAYHDGNRTTFVSFLVITETTSTPPVSDCSVCWKLLVSVCPVCVLLSSVVSSTCVYWIYRSRTKADGRAERRGNMEMRNHNEVGDGGGGGGGGGDVVYAPLDIPSSGQRRLKKRTVESSDLCTYSESSPPPVCTAFAAAELKLMVQQADEKMVVVVVILTAMLWAVMEKRNVPLTWTNQISAQTSASKTLTITSPPAPVSEMERSRAVLITLMCVLISTISGIIVEMRVKPGDDAAIYSDCTRRAGYKTVWLLKPLHDHQPPLRHLTEDLMHSRYSRVWNSSKRMHDLLVKNITKSDLGLYYCALHGRKNTQDEKGVIRPEDIYHYGRRFTYLTLLGVLISSTSGLIVEMRVKPGDNATIYCDRIRERGFKIAWIIKPSSEHQPPVLHLTEDSELPRYSLVWNDSSLTYHLLVENVRVVSFSPQRTFGAEVDMTIRLQDNVTIYSDCVWRSGYYIAWFRNSSHEHRGQHTENLMLGAHPRYKSVWNPSNRTYDLLVRNMSESDLGLYYCAVQDKITREDAGVMVYEDVYHYGSRATRLSLLDSTVPHVNHPETPSTLQTPSTPPFTPTKLTLVPLLSASNVGTGREHLPKIIFTIASGFYQFEVMPFGLAYSSLNNKTNHYAVGHNGKQKCSTDVDQSDLSTDIRLKDPHHHQTPSTRSRDALITLMCVLISSISGTVEVRQVKLGDKVTIYSDCTRRTGYIVAWLIKPSHEHQPPLIRLSEDPTSPHYSRVWNSSNGRYDLLVKNITESDLGLYYCALHMIKFTKKENGDILRDDIFHEGNRTTFLSFLAADGTAVGRGNMEMRNHNEVGVGGGGGDVCYTSLDILSSGQRRLKKRTAESYDLCTYSERVQCSASREHPGEAASPTQGSPVSLIISNQSNNTKEYDSVASIQDHKQQIHNKQIQYLLTGLPIGVWLSRISGEEVEVKVRPGDNAVLYGDCGWKIGFSTIWFRNSSHEHMYIHKEAHPRCSILWSPFSKTSDLLVRNVSESDLGLYYCALQKTRSIRDKARACFGEDVCLYGNRTTRLSFHVGKNHDSAECSCETTRNPASGKHDKVGGEDACYASLDLLSRGQKRQKKKVESFEFSTCSEVTYSEVKGGSSRNNKTNRYAVGRNGKQKYSTDVDQSDLSTDIRFKDPRLYQPPAPVSEMERSRVALITLMCVLISSISGLIVEMKVKPGDNATIYCDCALRTKYTVIWQRKSSHELEPPLIHFTKDSTPPRYSFEWNSSSTTHDLQVEKVTESDLGLYYCALTGKKLNTSGGRLPDVHHEGNRTTFLSFLGVLISSISGLIVEMRVKPGDNATIYCDCTRKTRHTVIWQRKSSHKVEPPLIHFTEDSEPHYSFKWNSSSQTYDLLVENITESDLGLYYCALTRKGNTGGGGLPDVPHERNRTTFLSFLGVLVSSISGVIVEMRVKPGDNATMYCDCALRTKYTVIWQRKSSHELEPPLIHFTKDSTTPRYSFEWNSSSTTHDLLVEKVTESDLGLYYCTLIGKKLNTSGGRLPDIHHEGNRTTFLSFLDTPSTPRVSDCSVCWKLLVSVCLLCVLLTSVISSTWMYRIYRNRTRGVLISTISGIILEMRVKPGDNATIYCDCTRRTGAKIGWLRKSSHNLEPPLISFTEDSELPRYSFQWNSSSLTYDLLVEKVTESDLGLYYCALHEIKFTRGRNGARAREDVYHDGNRTTFLSFLDKTVPCNSPPQSPSTLQSPSTPPVSDCSVCWKLLDSVCPVCVLLTSVVSSTCVYCICRRRTKGVLISSISGLVVEMRVKPGDNATIYCDCSQRTGYTVIWLRKSSHKLEPPLKQFTKDSTPPRYSFKWNSFSLTYDLLVENITETDLGLYYCALTGKGNTSGGRLPDVHHEGSRTTFLSFLADGTAERRGNMEMRNHNEVGGGGGGDVCYASLDIPSSGQRRLKKRTVENSDLCTYSEDPTGPPGVISRVMDNSQHCSDTGVLSSRMSGTELEMGFKAEDTIAQISGAHVELRVGPGDDATLYSDCVSEDRFNIIWFRNCSHQHQPPLMISATDLMRGTRPHYSAVWNPSNQTYDLLVKNVSESDLGLYYCALHQKKITKDSSGVIVFEDVYHYGNRTTLLSLPGSKERREPLTGSVFQLLVPIPTRPPPPLLDQTVVSAGSCWNKELQNVSNCTEELPDRNAVSFPTITADGAAERRGNMDMRNHNESLQPWYYLELEVAASLEPCVAPFVKAAGDRKCDNRKKGGSTADVTGPGVWFSRISGADVEVKVRPGDNVVLYSDCVWKHGFITVWFRNSSHEHMVLKPEAHPRYSVMLNVSSQTTNLLVKNVNESDLGLYFCALQKKRSSRDGARACSWEDVCYYGNRTTRLSFHDTTTQTTPTPLPTPPVSDCGVCWKLLVSVCPVCVLLCSSGVYCVYRYTIRVTENDRRDHEKMTNRKTDKLQGGGDDVCYASLDLPMGGQRRLKKKKKRVECSEFSTYSETREIFHSRRPIRRMNTTIQASSKKGDQSKACDWLVLFSHVVTYTSEMLIIPPAPVSEMERSRVALIALMCAWFSRISGAHVELRVGPGDDATLYSDCVSEDRFNIVWFRNCSHQHQPSLMISAQDLIHGTPPRYSAVWNPSNQTYDLLVKNVSESDLGLYYCALHQKKITKDSSGVIVSENVYRYGNRTTRLSLPATCADPHQSNSTLQTPSTPPVSDCRVCWKLLVSVCPVCVLLSSTCVYCICRRRSKGTLSLPLDNYTVGSSPVAASALSLVPEHWSPESADIDWNPCVPQLKIPSPYTGHTAPQHDGTTTKFYSETGGERRRTTQSRRRRETEEVDGDEICYASLDLPSRGPRRLKKKRVESFDLSTYSEVKVDKTINDCTKVKFHRSSRERKSGNSVDQSRCVNAPVCPSCQSVTFVNARTAILEHRERVVVVLGKYLNQQEGSQQSWRKVSPPDCPGNLNSHGGRCLHQTAQETLTAMEEGVPARLPRKPQQSWRKVSSPDCPGNLNSHGGGCPRQTAQETSTAMEEDVSTRLPRKLNSHGGRCLHQTAQETQQPWGKVQEIWTVGNFTRSFITDGHCMEQPCFPLGTEAEGVDSA